MQSWHNFAVGKRHKKDVAEFSSRLISNLWELQRDIAGGGYRHGGYMRFKICDQKPRDIHKASVRDRIVHHALCRALYPYFDRKFIFDSYSCRVGKGTHRALRRFAAFARRVSRNHGHTAWVLSCDIKKCFASVDHEILRGILYRHIPCPKTRMMADSIIDSFSISRGGVGMPLGNLTSQLFINIYLNELDHYIKRVLKVRFYLRYADDFVILSCDRYRLTELLPRIEQFAHEQLRFHLRHNDRPIQTVASGVDFLGWVHFPDHRVLRSATKWRMLQRLEQNSSLAALASYRGLLGHGNEHKLNEAINARYGRYFK